MLEKDKILYLDNYNLPFKLYSALLEGSKQMKWIDSSFEQFVSELRELNFNSTKRDLEFYRKYESEEGNLDKYLKHFFSSYNGGEGFDLKLFLEFVYPLDQIRDGVFKNVGTYFEWMTLKLKTLVKSNKNIVNPFSNRDFVDTNWKALAKWLIAVNALVYEYKPQTIEELYNIILDDDKVKALTSKYDQRDFFDISVDPSHKFDTLEELDEEKAKFVEEHREAYGKLELISFSSDYTNRKAQCSRIWDKNLSIMDENFNTIEASPREYVLDYRSKRKVK